MWNFNKTTTEFEHNGVKAPYDGCSSLSLKKAKEFYLPLGYRYIGSGNVIYVNGKRNEFNETYYFFKRN